MSDQSTLHTCLPLRKNSGIILVLESWIEVSNEFLRNDDLVRLAANKGLVLFKWIRIVSQSCMLWLTDSSPHGSFQNCGMSDVQACLFVHPF